MFEPLPPAVACASLRALVTVALSDGPLTGTESEILSSVQSSLLRSDYDVGALEPIEGAELSRVVLDPQHRHCVVSGCALLSMIDWVVDPREGSVVRAFADALEVSSDTVTDMTRYAEKRLFALRLGLLRRYEPAQLLKKAWREKGPAGIYRFFQQALCGDSKTAALYAKLGDYPQGTLGRAYFEFVRGHGYSLPGEKGANPEAIAFHDCMHVLTEYGVTPAEEALISAFEAGCHDVDHFGMLTFGMLTFGIVHFHLEVQVCPLAPPSRIEVDPADVVEALARGHAVPSDLFETFRPEEHFHQPVSEVRRVLGIPPRHP